MSAGVALLPDQPVTMTSLELVDFINSQRTAGEAELRHDHFMAKVPKVLGETSPKFSGFIEKPMPNGGKRQQPIYRFPKREACLMAMSYSYDLQAKVFDRMTALEGDGMPKLDLKQPGQMLAVAMQLAELCQEQAALLTAAEPKIAFAEAVGDAENLQKIGEVAKALGTGPRRLWAFLREERILMVNDLPYQVHLDAGRFKVIEVPYRDREGAQRIKLETRVTGRGVTFLQQRLANQREVAHG